MVLNNADYLTVHPDSPWLLAGVVKQGNDSPFVSRSNADTLAATLIESISYLFQPGNWEKERGCYLYIGVK